MKRPSVTRRVCPWCGQSERVVKGRWALHVDPNIVPKGSDCDGSGKDYQPRQYVVKHDGIFRSRGF